MMTFTRDVKVFLTANNMNQNDDKTEFRITDTTGQQKNI